MAHGLNTLGAFGHLHLRLRLELAVGRRELLDEIVDLHLQLGLHLLIGLRTRIHLCLQRVCRVLERLICRVKARVVHHESLVDRFLDGSGHRRLRHVASFEGGNERFVRIRAFEPLPGERLVCVLELREGERLGLLDALRGRLQVGRIRRLELLLHLRDRLDPPRLERRDLVIERLLESGHRRARRLHEVIVLLVQRRDGGRLPAGDRLEPLLVRRKLRLGPPRVLGNVLAQRLDLAGRARDLFVERLLHAMRRRRRRLALLEQLIRERHLALHARADFGA